MLYNLFISKIARPSYLYVIKPICFLSVLLWLIIKYLFVALSGNLIFLILLLIVWRWIDYILEIFINEVGALFVIFLVFFLFI